ncbi:MAG: hypothetical protein R2715_08775 [Ilumatobacteraceae bacterium]
MSDLLIEVLTDNRNRSGSDVRSIFSKMAARWPSRGGRLAVLAGA